METAAFSRSLLTSRGHCGAVTKGKPKTKEGREKRKQVEGLR